MKHSLYLAAALAMASSTIACDARSFGARSAYGSDPIPVPRKGKSGVAKARRAKRKGK